MGLNSFQTSGNSPGDLDRCHIGILGFGTVGSAVARRLASPDVHPLLALTHICDRRAREQRGRQVEPLAQRSWTDRFDDLLASDIDIIVEAVPGSEPAVDYIRAALLAGKSVVTANRQVIAHHGPALLTLAERQGRQIRFEAAVGGAMPLVHGVGAALAGDRLLRIDAILNATSNVVLSRLEAGGTVDEAIAEACASGLTESDPATDLEGIDAAAKLAILCALGFGLKVPPSAIDRRSTSTITTTDMAKARLRGGTIRQIAHAAFDRERRELEAWVAPAFVRQESLFARTVGAQNAAVITCAHAGEISMAGAGAGGEVTAAAILGDILAIARDRAAIVPAPVLVPAGSVKGLSDSDLAEAV